jgi:hypothetical protein
MLIYISDLKRMVIVLVTVVVMVVVDVNLWIGGGDVTNVVILHHLLAENGNWPLLAVLCCIVVVPAPSLLAKHYIYQQVTPTSPAGSPKISGNLKPPIPKQWTLDNFYVT